MKIQSLSIAVPAGCPNRCSFGVCEMHRGKYLNQIENNRRFTDLYEKDYMDAMAFARDNGCNTLMFTGDGEPLMNTRFMDKVATWNKMLDQPFRNLELQTCGVGLDDERLRWLRNTVRVKVISLSISSFDSEENGFINGTLTENVKIADLCAEIKRYDFTLRLSLNMNSSFDSIGPISMFSNLKALGADQVLFRQLYAYGQGKEAEWVRNNAFTDRSMDTLLYYIDRNGTELERLPFGAVRMAVDGISTVVDKDCMNQEVKEEVKYLVLREDCKLYTKWDEPGSRIF